MLKVWVKKDDPNGLEKALRKFKKICMDMEQEYLRHTYYLKPGLKKKQKSKLALQRKWQDEKKQRLNRGKQYGKNYKRTTWKD